MRASLSFLAPLLAPLLAVVIGCGKDHPASEAASKPAAQSAEDAAAELCKAAGKIVGDPAKHNLVAWLEVAGDEVQHKGVREVLEQLGKSGSPDPSDPFFAGMADVLGHEWDCPAARTILGGS